jgi:hypothetical protein
MGIPTVRRLVMTQYVFHSDPSHAWLEVKRSELEALGIGDEISRYSYQYGLTVYLEEDCDAPAFLAAKGQAFERFTFEDRHVDGDSFIRSYMPYKPPYL